MHPYRPLNARCRQSERLRSIVIVKWRTAVGHLLAFEPSTLRTAADWLHPLTVDPANVRFGDKGGVEHRHAQVHCTRIATVQVAAPAEAIPMIRRPCSRCRTLGDGAAGPLADRVVGAGRAS